MKIPKAPGEKLGISIRGGNKGHPGNPLDRNDEGIFISKVCDVLVMMMMMMMMMIRRRRRRRIMVVVIIRMC